MKKFILLFYLLTFFQGVSFGYDYITVQDPDDGRSATGSIDEAVLTVTPHGLYMEYELTLEFAVHNSYYQFIHNDSLEVQFYFDLPENAIVNDLWLWIGDYISKAQILDKWTASAIYENIVKRRRDPAILYKNDTKQYELRIYPMPGDESRKIKLTYLVPVQWNLYSVSAPVPVNLLRTSASPLANLTVIYRGNDEWKNPRISEDSTIKFSESQDSTGSYLKADIPYELFISSSVNIEMDSPMKDGIYFSRLTDSTSGLYQLALVPGKSFNLQVNRKILLLIDYEISKSLITASELLSSLRTVFQSNLAPTDSFNIIIAGLEIKRLNDYWIPGDSISVDAAFDSLGTLSDYSNLTSLLNNGIDFLNLNGRDGSIVLVSNTDQVGGYQVANALLTDLKDKMDEPYPVYVLDFLTNDYQWYYINNRYYYGNEYFFENLSRTTKGEYVNTRSGDLFSTLATNLLQSVYGYISSFDFYTTLQNGYCFSRLTNDNTNMIYLNKPITQIGKYSGSMPFVINASGVFNSEIFSKNITIEESAAGTSDTLISKMWAGIYIKSLESEQQANNIINEIIDFSMSERILSLYTAFLSLEPGDSINTCFECEEDGGGDISEVEEEIITPSEFKIEGYPNPFNSQVKFNVMIPAEMNSDQVSFKIYNILGQVVKTFEVSFNQGGQYKIEWNGVNDFGELVSSGIYLFVVQTPEKNYTHKIVLMK